MRGIVAAPVFDGYDVVNLGFEHAIILDGAAVFAAAICTRADEISRLACDAY